LAPLYHVDRRLDAVGQVDVDLGAGAAFWRASRAGSAVSGGGVPCPATGGGALRLLGLWCQLLRLYMPGAV
jgi:hypothetical protein